MTEAKDTYYIGNAGLVLFNPYLPILFERLGLLARGDDGRSRIDGVEARSRAVHLLQYLVDGRTDRPEPELVLNKLLAGIAIDAPIAPSIELTTAEQEICDGLLGAVIANWSAVRNTSVAGLQETFLQREGRLRHAEGRSMLQVQRKTIDVLVDQVPWSFLLVYQRWMAEPVHVTW